ncbi:hypothetical protein HDU67_007176 [Dinochytrium kinnereticum]|nr:hypothetical protein HDU67_007176 [Dinochytrium kinnereticum]
MDMMATTVPFDLGDFGLGMDASMDLISTEAFMSLLQESSSVNTIPSTATLPIPQLQLQHPSYMNDRLAFARSLLQLPPQIGQESQLPLGMSPPTQQQQQQQQSNNTSFPTMPADRVSEKTRYNLACARCRAKKRKCDGNRPACSNCVRAQAKSGGKEDLNICYYEETVKRKPRKPTNRSDALLDKLNALESMLKPLQNSLPFQTLGATIGSTEERSPSLSQHLSEEGDDPCDDSPAQQTITTAQALEAQIQFIMKGTSSSAQTALVKSPRLPSRDLFSSLSTPGAISANSLLNGSSSSYFLDDLPESMFINPSASPFTSAMSEVRMDESLFRSLGSPLFSEEMPLRMEGAREFTNFVPLISTTSQNACVENFADLETHLIAIYFTYVNRMLPMMREDIFLADYVPVNRHHSALLNAMMGTATIFSQHPQIYKRFKSPYKAAQHYLELAEKQVVTVTDCVVSMQTMMLIGFWDFYQLILPLIPYINYHRDAFLECKLVNQWIGQSCRESHKLNLRNSLEFCDYKFSVWRGPIDQATPAQYEIRYRTWQTLFILDTSATMVSGLSLALAEEDYASVLVNCERRLKTMIRNHAKRKGGRGEVPGPPPEFASMAAGDTAGASGEWKKVFANVPGDSVFDVPSPVRRHPALFRAKESVFARWGVEPADWVKEVPAHLLTSEFDQYYLVQLSFIIRRICRLTQRRNVPPDFTDSFAALSVLPSLADATQLHEALIQFYFSLPESERPFKSFDDIPSSSSVGTEVPYPSSQSHASWVLRSSAVNLQMNFFAALALLHDPSLSDGKRQYKISALACGGGKRINSLEVLVMAQHAQVHILRCVYSAYGGAFRPAPSKAARNAANAVAAAMTSDSGLSPPYTEASSASSPAACCSPPVPVTVGDMAGMTSAGRLEHLMSLWDQSGGGGKAPTPDPSQTPPPLPREMPFSVENPPPPLPMVECPMSAFFLYTNAVSVLTMLMPGGVPDHMVQLARSDDGPVSCLVGIRTVVIPALVEIMRVWRVGEIYLVRVRQLFDEVTSHLESRMPAFAKRFKDIFVETSVLDLKDYMTEFSTIKSRQSGMSRTVDAHHFSAEEGDAQSGVPSKEGGQQSRAADTLADLLASETNC